MRYASLALFLLVLTAACGGGNAAPMPEGAPALSVLSGNNQTVSAAPAVPLPNQVVAQVVRLPNGQVSMTSRVVNAMLPQQAYAQGTAVVGIPGAVVCAVSPDPQHQLTPEVPCTNTDATGKAYFTLHADTVAGIARSQVRGTVAGVTQVSDSVKATVVPLPTARWDVTSFNTPLLHVGDTVFVRRDQIAPNIVDKYGNRLTSYLVRFKRTNNICHVALVNGSCPSPGYDSSGSDAAWVTGDIFVVRTGDTQFTVAVDSIEKGPVQINYKP